MALHAAFQSKNELKRNFITALYNLLHHLKEVKSQVCIYNNLLEAAGAILMWISLMIYSGTALMAMITPTFHANASETTKERSWKQENLHQLVGVD